MATGVSSATNSSYEFSSESDLNISIGSKGALDFTSFDEVKMFFN